MLDVVVGILDREEGDVFWGPKLGGFVHCGARWEWRGFMVVEQGDSWRMFLVMRLLDWGEAEGCGR